MISFRMDGRSAVPPYLQIVQQVRQALRMGVLDVGDQLPTVREVVAATAINPNTVLKAYRDLEREGLVRPGPGTARSCWAARRGRRPARTPGWAAAWPGGCGRPARPGSTTSRSNRCCASRCGRQTRRRSHDPRHRDPGLAKRYRRVTALTDCTITVPEGRISRADRPERRGQDHAAAAAGRAGQADRGRGRRCSAARPARTRPSWPRSASWPRRSRCTGG